MGCTTRSIASGLLILPPTNPRCSGYLTLDRNTTLLVSSSIRLIVIVICNVKIFPRADCSRYFLLCYTCELLKCIFAVMVFLYNKNILNYFSSPHLTDDNTSTDVSTPIESNKSNSRLSPEMLPSYGKLLKNFFDKKIKNGTRIWNKENGKSIQDEVIFV